MMTPEDRTIQMGMIIAAESFGFDFEGDAEAGLGSGPTTSLSAASSSGFELRNWACSTISTGRPAFSKNFSVDILWKRWGIAWVGGGGRRGSKKGE